MADHPAPDLRIAFIGGGNMANAIIGGLRRSGWPGSAIDVVEPDAAGRERLVADHGVNVHPLAGPALAGCTLVVWAVKPQVFGDAARAVAPHLARPPGTAGHPQPPLHVSVAAGIRIDSIAAWLGLAASDARIVRCMPNTPALVGRGMTGLFAPAGVSADERALVERVLKPTGELAWLREESQLDAVTALSGSGPAYVFFFLEAMAKAGAEMGLDPALAQRLAVQTFVGAAHLAQDSPEPPATLRERVTSKGGTTHAAITSMQGDGVDVAFARALHAARLRAREMANAFGAG